MAYFERAAFRLVLLPPVLLLVLRAAVGHLPAPGALGAGPLAAEGALVSPARDTEPGVDLLPVGACRHQRVKVERRHNWDNRQRTPRCFHTLEVLFFSS